MKPNSRLVMKNSIKDKLLLDSIIINELYSQDQQQDHQHQIIATIVDGVLDS